MLRVGGKMSSDILQLERIMNPNPLIRNKLHIPVVQQKLLSRTRLDHELNNGLQGKLILITAPAGFGKTTAVINWIGQVNRPVAWFSIDSSDNSLKRFWNYIIAALHTIMPGLENRFFQFFQTPNTMTVQEVVTALVDEIYRYEKDFVFVMDDYHLIDEISIHDSIALLIKYLPQNAHLVVISRSYPPFSSVRLETVGHIKEIQITDLQFTRQEIVDFCKEKGVSLTTEDVKALESRTEGWAAGLYLILDSVKQNSDLSKMFSGFKRDSQRIASYLTQEVMNSWAKEEKIFMLKTSVLTTMSGSLCDEVTGRTDGREMLEKISRQNAFIIPMDDKGSWYRYHHLYSEFLQNQLDKWDNNLKYALHEKAGIWFEKNGYIVEAVRHFLQSCSYEKAANAIELKGRELLKTGDTATLLDWFSNLPVTLIESRDLLCLTYAWALILADRIDEAQLWSNLVESRLKAPCAAAMAPEWKRQLEQEVLSVKGIIGLKQQNSDITLRSVIKLQEIMQQNTSIFVAFGLNFNAGEASLLGGMFGLKGRLSAIDQEYSGIYEKSRSMFNLRFGYVPVMMGELYYERNRIDEAVPLLLKGAEEAEERGVIGSLVPAMIALAKVMKVKGDIQGALAMVQEGEKKLRDLGGSHMFPLLAAFRARLNIETGASDAVEDWMRNNCLELYGSPSKSSIYEYITLARVLIARKDYDPCLLLLLKLLLIAQKEQNLPYILEILNLEAMVYHGLGQTQKAMETLRESLLLGEKEGYERIFIEEGIPMAALLGRFIRWNIKQKSGDNSPISIIYVRKLIKSTREYCKTSKTFLREKAKVQGIYPHLNEPLTKRETDVLRLLDSELTNVEIAYTLDISVNTVKVNCTNIYRKLGVRNRQQAIACAHEINILH